MTGNDSQVIKIEELEGKLRLHLASGGSREVDFALHSTGVKPNIDVVLDSPIRVDRGILVNEHLETNVQGIFAAGDVAQAKDLLTGEFKTSPIWPNAVAQGKLAAYNMAGIEQEYTGEVGLQNAMEFRQVPAIAFGHSKGTEEDGFKVITIHKPEKGIYKKLVLENDVVKGMIFVGDVSKSGIITNLIKSGRHIGELKDRLLDEQFSLAYFVEERTPTFEMYVG